MQPIAFVVEQHGVPFCPHGKREIIQQFLAEIVDYQDALLFAIAIKYGRAKAHGGLIGEFDLSMFYIEIHGGGVNFIGSKTQRIAEIIARSLVLQRHFGDADRFVVDQVNPDFLHAAVIQVADLIVTLPGLNHIDEVFSDALLFDRAGVIDVVLQRGDLSEELQV